MVKRSQNLPDFDKMWDYNNPRETEEKFQEILKDFDLENEQSYRLQLLTQIARTFGLRQKFYAAHDYLKKVKEELDRFPELKLVKIRYLLESGRAYNSNSEKSKAKELFIQAWELAKDLKEEYYAADAGHMVGISETGEESLNWNLKTIDYIENANHPKVKNWLGPLLNNTAWTYHDNGNFKKALILFEKGLEFRKSRDDVQAILIAKWTIGRTYRSLNRIDEAIQIHNDLVKEYKHNSLSPDGYIHEELGECYLIKKEDMLSKQNFSIAYDILSKDIWLQENENDRLDRMKNLAGL